MSKRLRKRSSIWLGATAALCLAGWSAAQLHAQWTIYPSQAAAKTPEEAAQRFARLVEKSVDESASNYGDISPVISQRSLEQIPLGQMTKLLKVLHESVENARFDVRRLQTGSESATVGVTAASQPRSLPVVCIFEKGRYPGEASGWRVDLVATYAKRRNLKEGAYQQEIFDLTDVALPGLPHADRQEVQDGTCRNNLRQLALALLQYTQDYDERLPPARQWQDALEPYVRKKSTFTCPSAPGGKNGYAFNANLSEKPVLVLSEVDNSGVPILYDSTSTQRNAVGTGSDVAYRHGFEKRPSPPALSSVAYAMSHNSALERDKVSWMFRGGAWDFTLKPSPIRASNLPLSPAPAPN